MSMTACNLSSALFVPRSTEVPLPSAMPSFTPEIVPDSNQPTPTLDASGVFTNSISTLDMCTLVTKTDVEKFFNEPASEPKTASGGCLFNNVKDGVYAFSIGAAQDKESSSILQGQALLLGLAGVKLDTAVMAKIKPMAESLDYKGFFTELISASKSSDKISAKMFTGGGNDLTYWAWITVPPVRTGAFVAVRGTTLVSLYLVVPESQAEEAMLTDSNNLAGEIFKKLPAKFTIGTAASTTSGQPSSGSSTPTLVGSSAGQPAQAPAASGEATPTHVPDLSNVPILISPADGTVSDIYPRTITLTWSPVAGASKYLVEIMACSSTSPDTCFSHPMIEQTSRETASTSYTFNFVGAQPGKWRVSIIDANGVLGTPSAWWKFRFTK